MVGCTVVVVVLEKEIRYLQLGVVVVVVVVTMYGGRWRRGTDKKATFMKLNFVARRCGLLKRRSDDADLFMKEDYNMRVDQ